MYKLFYILFVLCPFLMGCGDNEYNGSSDDNIIKIYEGTSYYSIAYTIRDNKIYEGTSDYDIAFTIRDNKIYEGTSDYDIAYTIGKAEF